MIITPGDSGCEAVTKISGVPWWPRGRERPACRAGHPMSFVLQVQLQDVPGFDARDNADTLIYFHYCIECSDAGNMSFGWDDSRGKSGYDVSIIKNIHSLTSDGLGLVCRQIVEPHSVILREVVEIPTLEDLWMLLPDLPDDYPQGKDDLDENVYPGLIHVHKRKLGGWPSWVQHPNPPTTESGERVYFIGQLDWWLCANSPWCTGYVYLFLKSTNDHELNGDIVLQTT